MAKPVSRAEAEQARQTVTAPTRVIAVQSDYSVTLSSEDIDRISQWRKDMRARLLAED